MSDEMEDETDVKMLKMDGYDDCIIGFATRFGMSQVLAYDKAKVLEKLQRDGMSEYEANEFFEYNQIGAWLGAGTPVFVELTKGKIDNGKRD